MLEGGVGDTQNVGAVSLYSIGVVSLYSKRYLMSWLAPLAPGSLRSLPCHGLSMVHGHGQSMAMDRWGRGQGSSTVVVGGGGQGSSTVES